MFKIIFAHIFSWNNAFLRILSKRRAARTSRGRSISEAMKPFHGEEVVVESLEMEVNSHWRQEGGRQPLPGEVPMEQRELELNVGWSAIQSL